MSEKGRIVSHPQVEVEAEVPRHKCCWVAFLSLCLLTVNTIVCVHLARRLAYVEGQLAKQGVSSEEASNDGRFGYHADMEMSYEAKVQPATVKGNKIKEDRDLYSGSAWPPSTGEFAHQSRNRRSEREAIEDVRLTRERNIWSLQLTGRGIRYTVVSMEGDVIIKVGGRWFHVCFGTFGRREADVACRQFGGEMFLLDSGTFRRHPETLWSPVVSCQGYEQNLGDCKIVATNARCEGAHSVGLTCNATTEVRLDGGQKPNEGRVEFSRRYRSSRTFCKKGWNIHASDVVCRQLGYKRAVPISVDFGPGSGTILFDDVHVRCLGNESSIMNCQYSSLDNCDKDNVAGVVCDVDDCNSNPCQNNGTCIEAVGHYTCQCARGWAGVHCERKEKLLSMERSSRGWAHIKAASDSKGDTHTVKRHETVLTKHWEQFEPSEKFRFNSGVLTVFEEGDYYIYSQVYYRYNNKQSTSISHSVMVVKDDKHNPYRFLTCWKYMEETTPWKTCFTAGVIHLSPNNSVYLHMPCDGCVIKLDHDATFFGDHETSQHQKSTP